MRRALILTYYWPPSGGSGVQRWLRLSNYLRGHDWEPIICTAKNAEYPVLDPSLCDQIPSGIEIVRLPIWEPYSLYKWFVGQPKATPVSSANLEEAPRPRTRDAISRWIRGNLFIPDARRFWIKPSVRRILRFLAGNPVDLLVTTGPPMSAHLIGLGVKKRSSVRWIADFRDPWLHTVENEGLRLSGWARRAYARLERQVLDHCDGTVVVSPGMKADVDRKCPEGASLVMNGYDATHPVADPETPTHRFTISLVGTLMYSQNCPALWRILGRLAEEMPEFRRDLSLRFTGKVDARVLDEIRAQGLAENLVVSEYVPHQQVREEHERSSVLLLLINRGSHARHIVTGKLFEYLSSRRPILCIGPPEGDAARIVEETHAGRVAAREDEEAMARHILELYRLFLSGVTNWPTRNFEQYSWQAQAGRMAGVFDAVMGRPTADSEVIDPLCEPAVPGPA